MFVYGRPPVMSWYAQKPAFGKPSGWVLCGLTTMMFVLVLFGALKWARPLRASAAICPADIFLGALAALSTQVPLSTVLLPNVGFLPVSDPRIAATIEAIERRLMRNGLVMRYSTEHVKDALPPGEGAFLACSFWLVDVYILQERLDEAETLFRRLIGLCNEVGLLSEDYDPSSKRVIGNFPQAFSHVALVNSAYNLTRVRKPVHQRAQDEHAPPAAVREKVV